MGQDSILTKEQKQILDLVGKNDFLRSTFYFTGGTALAEVYLQHRESVDIDLFTKGSFDTQEILGILNAWSKKLNFTITPRVVGPTYICLLKFPQNTKLKVDFSKYPYTQLREKVKYSSIDVDSIFDIATNKLLTINQRTQVKDFVDLYFLLQEFNYWELKDGVEAKFNVELEPVLSAADFMKVEDFDVLPKMIKRLEIDELKRFFMGEAKKLGVESVE